MRKHKAIIKGVVIETYWKTNIPFRATLNYIEDGKWMTEELKGIREIAKRDMRHTFHSANWRIKEYREFWEGEINLPYLRVGEKLFITDMGVEVVIDEVIRTTEDNTCLYITGHTIENVASEDYEETEEYNEGKVREAKKEIQKDINKLDKMIRGGKKSMAWTEKIFGRG